MQELVLKAYAQSQQQQPKPSNLNNDQEHSN
jgi:hypothetical protein